MEIAERLQQAMGAEKHKDTAQQGSYASSDKLKGKRALITGGDSGIGRAVSTQFSLEGASVAIVYLPSEEDDAQRTKELVEKNGGTVMLIPCDLSHASNCKDAVTRAVQALGGIDILVNNAAWKRETGGIEDVTEDQWVKTFRTNIDSYFYVTKYALPHMPKDGVIVNSASVDSYIGVPSRIDYAATEGAVVAFTRSLSNQLVKRGIRVNAVAAGPVLTPLISADVGAELKMSTEDQKILHHGLGNWTPMDRLGRPSEIAPSYVFLAGKESAFMSGQTLHPNGGIVVNG
ncbi:putative oxidoreductase [Escovopsis weberi]|uniref:Putative oxidoreductase n=1 Tax=Escovopsis weberi TaxID=150374 RepID=A0A0M8MZ88_ESCWE|nr:putative oxidoreductase [Escovopsis weberi]